MKYQSGVKKACNILWSSKREEITFSHEFIFVFIPYFIAAIFPKEGFQN